MSSFRNLAKGGWHPEKNRDSSSSGGGGGRLSQIRGMVPGSSSKADQDKRREHENHVAAPLSSLRDPASFAPPPKHAHFHGAAAAQSGSTASTPSRSQVNPATTAATRGLGAPLPREMVQQQQYAQQAVQQQDEGPPPPPEPYRMDTTGLSTHNLPPPPVRRPGAASPGTAAPPRPPVRQATASPAGGRAPPPPPRQNPTPPITTAGRPQPALPPRLPPRQNSHPDLNSPAPPPAYHELDHVPQPDQGAVNRLAQAGVSVPGFDIGARNNSSPAPPTPANSGFKPPSSAQLGELQSRFSKMGTSSSSSEQETGTKYTGNTLTNAASSPAGRGFLKQHGSTVASAASSPAGSNFISQHGSTMAHAASSSSPAAQNMISQHGDKVASAAASPAGRNFIQQHGSSIASAATSPAGRNFVQQHGGSMAAAATGKKPPPPPPKKKELTADAPPVPVASKPRFP